MNKPKNQTAQLTKLALLVAITLVMAYTPLGYLRTPMLSVSFLTIPVAVGGILMGPGTGALLGLVFGLTSFSQAFTDGGMKSVLLSLNPLACFITTVVARVLCGWLAALVVKVCGTFDKRKIWSYFVGSFLCPLLNTVFFMGFIVIFYYNTDYIQGLCRDFGVGNPFTLVLAMVSIQGIIELLSCGLLGGLIAKGVSRAIRK